MRFDVAYVAGLILFILFCATFSKSSKEGLADNIEHERRFIKEQSNYFKNRRDSLGGKSGEQAFIQFPELDKFYQYDKNKPLGEQLVLNVMNEKRGGIVGKLHGQCDALKSCADIRNLKNDRGCGYCGATNKFLMGNLQGPFTDICPSGWSYSPQTCQKNKEKGLCVNLKSCHELVSEGDKKICGWCPSNSKAYVISPGRGIKVKYPEDKCDTPLLRAGQCAQGSGLCIGENYDKGPHSEECLKKMWKDIGCKSNSWVYGKMSDEKDARVKRWNSMSIPKIFKDMKQYKIGADGGHDDAKYLCYGKEKALERKEGFEGLGRDDISQMAHSVRILGEKKKEIAARQAQEEFNSHKSAQIAKGVELSEVRCQEDELWNDGPGTGMYVDQRIRVCNRNSPGIDYNFPKSV